jgi:hypothetical protein
MSLLLKGTEEDSLKIKELISIEEQIKQLYEEKAEILENISDLVIYQNDDGTWTRFAKLDTVKEILEKGTIFRANSITKYSSKIDVLKNRPKELG